MDVDIKDNTKIIKMVENGLVIIVLFSIIIILFPSLEKIVDKTAKQSAESSTQGVFNMAKDYYTNINLQDIVDLPFEIEFDENTKKGYIIYSNGLEYTPPIGVNLKIEGKLPSTGSVVIKKDGEIEAKNLKFKKYICGKASIAAPVVCVKDKNKTKE